MDAKAIGAANAYARALNSRDTLAHTGEGTGGSSFSDLLKGYAEDAARTATKSEQGSLAAIAGGKAELVDIVAAVTNAEVTIETVTALRDRVIGAYQDIMKMPM